MYKIILHPTDLREYHYKLTEKAVDIARRLKAKLYLLHVIDTPASLQLAQSLGFAEYDKPVKDNAQTVMDVLGEAMSIPREQLLVEVGSVKHTILNKADALGCDLIIIGSHEPGHMEPLLGSTAYSIVHHARCDVLTLRSDLMI